MNILKKVLSDPVNKWFFKQTKKDAYLVGGYIRDLLRGELSKDKDFVVRNNVENIARKAAKKFNGTFIELQKKQTFRVALKRHRFIDFTYLRGDIADNLSKRDFTINAIAWSPEAGIITPADYLDDLKNGIIRVVKHENLLNDPLRVLRAYRISAQLEFDIENTTRRYLQKYSGELIKVSSERLSEELFKILNSNNSAHYLRLCSNDKVIYKILPVTPSIINKNIELINKFDNFVQKIKKLQKDMELYSYLDSLFSQGLKISGLIRLYLLTRCIDFNTSKFIKKERKLSQKFRFLQLSNKIRKSLCNLMNAELASCGRMTEKALFEIFKRAEDNVYEIAIIQYLLKNTNKRRFIKRAKDFLKIKNKVLLNGKEIQNVLNIGSNKIIIGKIKDQIFEKQFRGIIKNKSEARQWIISNFT